MIRYVQIAPLLVAAETSVLCAAPKEPAKIVRPTQPPRPPAAPKGAAKIGNPGASVARRLMRVTPEQRERALEKLPPQQQAQIRQRLERFDKQPPQQRERMIQQYQEFQSLPPEKQNLVTRQIQAVNQLPEDRGPVVRAELQHLRGCLKMTAKPAWLAKSSRISSLPPNSRCSSTFPPTFRCHWRRTSGDSPVMRNRLPVTVPTGNPICGRRWQANNTCKPDIPLHASAGAIEFQAAMDIVASAARDHLESLKNPQKTVEQYLDTLEAQGLTQSVSVLRELML
jgi:hypothetical protein